MHNYQARRDEMLRLAGARPLLRESVADLVESVADQIIQQLGGSQRVQAMIGPTIFLDHGKGVSLKFANKTPKKANYVLITLNSDDTYTMDFKRGRGMTYKTVAEVSDIYASELKRTFERHTGLVLSL